MSQFLNLLLLRDHVLLNGNELLVLLLDNNRHLLGLRLQVDERLLGHIEFHGDCAVHILVVLAHLG